MVKIILTICSTILFNQFLTINFTIDIVTLFLSSLLFSMFFYSVLSSKIDLITDAKDILK